jgi:3-hydroxypropanoate dehydrogenase
MAPPLDTAALDRIFRAARTHSAFVRGDLTDDQLRAVYDLAKFGPTSANSSPARFVFLRSNAAKERLRPALSAGNLEKTMVAAVTVIIGYDLAFYERLPELFLHNPGASGWFKGNTPLIEATAFRNSSMQGAYFIVAARALGLDCGPMSGFDNARVDAEFFPSGKIRSNFLCNLGVGDPTKLPPRNPRLSFEQACSIL